MVAAVTQLLHGNSRMHNGCCLSRRCKRLFQLGCHGGGGRVQQFKRRLIAEVAKLAAMVATAFHT